MKKSRYQKLWEVIKSSDQPVVVKCPKRYQQTLVQAVRKAKAADNVLRKALEMERFGKLLDTRTEDSVIFQLEWNSNFF